MLAFHQDILKQDESTNVLFLEKQQKQTKIFPEDSLEVHIPKQ